MALTNMELSTAKPKDKDYKLTDGKGLYLLVNKNGRKYWRWNYRFDNKQKTMAFGVYPEITAKAAREKRDKLRLILAEGDDPKLHIENEKQLKLEKAQEGILFGEVLDAWFNEWKTEYKANTIKRNGSIIDIWLKPYIGHIPAKQINANDILGVIRRLENLEQRPTAHKAFTILKKTFSYAIADPALPIDRNWAVDIGELKKPLLESHYAAMITPKEVGQLLHNIATSSSAWLTKLAMRLSLHWFIRPGELRNLYWTDINWEMSCVQISADKLKKTKTVQEHWIPLSKQAKKMLEFIQHNGYKSELVFPSNRNLTKPISENTVNTALSNMGYKGVQTAHGLRATARTLLEEELNENPLYVEHQLAHVVRDANGRAYNRTTMLDERRAMLQRWSDYLDELEHKATRGIEIKSKYETSLNQ